jgi:pimeloyl-ACP methyl ester carboxylesterase
MIEMLTIEALTVRAERPARPTQPPVLFIHGYFATATIFDRWLAYFAARGFPAFAVNLRGRAGSRPGTNIGTVSLADFVDDASVVAREVGARTIVGHSMGGLIAQKVAERGACRGVVLLAAAPPRWIPPVSWLLLRKQIKYVRALVLFEAVTPDRSDADALMFNRTPVPERAGFFARLVAESGRAGFQLSVGAIDVNASRVTAPVLVVTGEDDRFVVPRVARALARKYNAPLKSYPSFAHHIMAEPGWEKPCSDIIDWLDAHA